MGEVFAAENIRTGRPVAVKLLRSDSKAKSSAVARFRREARAAGSINSDHVTQVLDVEEDSEHGIVLVFELLEGESLIDRLKRTGPIPFDELFPIIDQVWIGLADAHKAGIIHRDLKPSNVFLERRPDGQIRVKILDFGISKLPKEMGGETLTEMGQSLGTFSFMPPEQIGKAKTVDHRADIYACATLIYQALSGQLPYAARNILVMVEMKSKTDARKLADVMGGPVDPRLEAFIARGLARDPAARFQTALDALTAWRDMRPDSAEVVRTSQSQQMRAVQQPPSVVTPPLATHDRQPQAPPPQSPMASESTTDTAATLAMPLSHLTNQANAAAARQAPRPMPNPAQRGFGATVPLASPASEIIKSAAQAAASGSPYVRASSPAQSQPHPQSQPQAQQPAQAQAPQSYYGPPRQPQPQPQTASRPQQAPYTPPSGVHATPRVFDDGAADPPVSMTERTRVYRPRLQAAPPGSGRAELAPNDATMGGTVPIPLQQRKRNAIPLVLGAIAFALVGFGIVVVFMYLRGGLNIGH